MVDSLSYLRPPPPELQRRLDLHRLWLETEGREGVQIGSDTDEPLDCVGIAVDGIDLSLALLSSSDFAGSSLRGAWFFGADLEAGVLAGCDLSGSRFDSANLRLADLKRAICRGIRLDRADLTGTVMYGSDCAGASFEGTSMEKTLWTPDQAKRFHLQEMQRLESLADTRKSWGAAEWAAFHAGPQQASGPSEEEQKQSDARAVRENLALWRRYKRYLPIAAV